MTSFLLALTFLTAPAAFAADEAAPPFVPGRVLVKFKSGVSKDKRREVLAKHQGRETGRIPRINVRIIELPENADEHAQVATLKARPEVKFAELDYYLAAALIPNDPYYSSSLNPEWHLPKIGCPAAWDLTTGSSSLIIAILDTGVYGSHPDLAAKMVPGWNVYDNNSNTSDKTGHGTLVAGQAAAVSNNGTGVAAVAWGCKVMPVVVANSAGWATDSTMSSGLIWAADHGARVANLSFEGPDNATMTSAAQYFESKGGLVVKSAGNSGTVDSSPDNPAFLKVSATDKDDLVPSWSVTGNCIDLAAPGVSIMTTTSTGTYASGTGTSASAPIVSGVAALMLSANPSLTGRQVQDILKESADDLGTPGWDTRYGWGRVNAARAVATAKNAGGQPADTSPPTVSFSSPAAGAVVTGTVNIQVSASDNVGVVSVSVSVDGSLLASDATAPYAFYWDSSKVSNGSHVLTATARDAAGNTASTQIAVTANNPVADTTPPTVSFSSPTAGATVNGTIGVQVSAGDNVGVSSVTLYVDGTSLGADTAAPYSFSWNTTTAANGSHSLTATARDAAGNACSAEITVATNNPVADTSPPTVSFGSPAAGATVSGTITVQVSAGDNVGVSSITLYVDGTSLGADTAAPYSFSWHTTTAANGSHSLTATARDAAGNACSAEITVTTNNPVADTSPPTVSFGSPAAGATVSGTITVQVSAGDNVGVSSVTLYVDGTSLGTDSTAPYSFSWNTAAAADGSHSLTATARDAAGNLANAQIAVTVNNAPPGDTTAPTIAITWPTGGATLSGTASVMVNASDNVGVVMVELYVDGVLQSTSTRSPFTIKWNTRKEAKGPHTLQCRAYDAAGNVGYSSVVTVYR